MLAQITHTCGHDAERNITNAAGQEPGPRSLAKSVAYWAQRECSNCWKAGKAGETAAALARFGSLPALVGTEKQVGWANTLREKALLCIGQWMDEGEAISPSSFNSTIHYANFTQMQGDRAARVALLARVVDARFWIDTRAHGFGEWTQMDALLDGGIGESGDVRVRFDLDAGRVILGKRSRQAEVRSRGRRIMVGGTKIHENEVQLG